MKRFSVISFVLVLTLLNSCRKDDSLPRPQYNPTPYNLDIPSNFPQMIIPVDNPLTEEGVRLGRHLFWDTRLSGDNSMACASCHLPSAAFTDTAALSTGIDGLKGKRNSMVLQNLGWASNYFWDGRAATLEQQVLAPVEDPLEMHEKWRSFMDEIRDDETYEILFYEAFGVVGYDSTHAAKALAQFLRTMISSNSQYDKVLRGDAIFTPLQQEGFDSFNSLSGGDCFHCHGGIMTTDHSFKNNGLDALPLDSGRGGVTGIAADNFTFKVPTLRNIEFSAPYMHDGRFATLDEVISHYSTGVKHSSPNVSPLMEFSAQGGVQLDPQERTALKEFLLMFTDEDFINNPKFRNPWGFRE